MAEMIALDQLPIEVQELLRRPAESDGYRSPVFKPLTDLRPQPFNRMHPRPTFVWSAPEPVNQPAYRHQPFPRRVFKPNGADVLDRTCRNVSEFQAAIGEDSEGTRNGLGHGDCAPDAGTAGDGAGVSRRAGCAPSEETWTQA